MTWEAVSALGQVVGAFAVVLTLVYLAAQVRQNTSGVKIGTTAGAIVAIQEWNYLFISDSSVRQVFHKGLNRMEILSEDESLQFAAFTVRQWCIGPYHLGGSGISST